MTKKLPHRRLASVVIAIGCLAGPAGAQDAPGSDDLGAALEVIRKAKERSRAGDLTSQAKEIIEDEGIEKRAGEALEKITQAASPEDSERFQEAAARLEKAKGNLSEEGARRLGVELAAGQAPKPSVPLAAPETGLTDEVASAPDPKQRKAPKSGDEDEGQTVISTGPDGSGVFDGEKRIAVFLDETDAVTLDSPKIYLTCAELEIHFKEDAAATEEEDGEGDSSGEGVMGDAGNSIDIVYARGRRVYIRKKNDTGKIQIGQCREAIYYGDSGDLVMKNWPQIQENDNLVIATDASTEIIIKRDGKLKFVGPTETRVANKKD